jgi:hypothetical protein
MSEDLFDLQFLMQEGTNGMMQEARLCFRSLPARENPDVWKTMPRCVKKDRFFRGAFSARKSDQVIIQDRREQPTKQRGQKVGPGITDDTSILDSGTD